MVNLSLKQQQYRKLRITLVDAIDYYQQTAVKLRSMGMIDLAKDYEARQRETRILYMTILKTATEYSIMEKAAEEDKQLYIHF